MAILRFPPIAVIDDRAVAAFGILDGFPAPAGDGDIFCPVADAQHLAVCRRHHVDARLLGRHGRHADVGPVMALVGERSALIILRSRGRVTVHVMLDEAGAADLAGDRQAEGNILGEGRAGTGQGRKGEQDRRRRAHDKSPKSGRQV
jgi:hypothetical protein